MQRSRQGQFPQATHTVVPQAQSYWNDLPQAHATAPAVHLQHSQDNRDLYFSQVPSISRLLQGPSVAKPPRRPQMHPALQAMNSQYSQQSLHPSAAPTYYPQVSTPLGNPSRFGQFPHGGRGHAMPQQPVDYATQNMPPAFMPRPQPHHQLCPPPPQLTRHPSGQVDRNGTEKPNTPISKLQTQLQKARMSMETQRVAVQTKLEHGRGFRGNGNGTKRTRTKTPARRPSIPRAGHSNVVQQSEEVIDLTGDSPPMSSAAPSSGTSSTNSQIYVPPFFQSQVPAPPASNEVTHTAPTTPRTPAPSGHVRRETEPVLTRSVPVANSPALSVTKNSSCSSDIARGYAENADEIPADSPTDGLAAVEMILAQADVRASAQPPSDPASSSALLLDYLSCLESYVVDQNITGAQLENLLENEFRLLGFEYDPELMQGWPIPDEWTLGEDEEMLEDLREDQLHEGDEGELPTLAR